MIWITSDTHFCHDKEFLYAPRGFTNPNDMNEAIIANWNSVVDPLDEVYHLGDVMLNDNHKGLKCLKQLNGRIHILRGNHDTDKRVSLYTECWNVVEIDAATYMDYGKYHFFLSHYPCMTGNFDYDKPLKARLISLCGHSHTKDRWSDWVNHPIYHCELDAHNNTPISIEQIIEDIKLRTLTTKEKGEDTWIF